MVLRRLAAFVLVALTTACLQPKPAPKLDAPTRVHSAVVLTHPDKADVDAAPDAVHDAIATSLTARNLLAQPADVASLAADFARKRATQDRLQLLSTRAAAAGEPFVLLTEATPRFYSLLSGRYRWDVDLRVTFAPTEALDQAHSRSWHLTAMLDYAHQDEVDALVSSAPHIADRVARVVDGFLTGYDGAPVSVATAPAAAETDPLHPGAAIYFVMVDRFHNGDPSNDGAVDTADPQAFHGGDFAGLQQRLSWLSDLGITSVWLSPIFAMRDEKFHGHGAFHGYWVEDFGKIEPRFGGEPALSQLNAAFAQHNLTLLLDVVLNHVAMDAPLLAQRPDWFHHNGPITDWNDRGQLEHHDVHGLPDLAQENPEVYEHLLGHSLQWLDALQPAGFRLDAVKHVPSSFWSRYNEAVRTRAGPHFVMLGEDLDGDAARVSQTMRDGGFNAMFDFPLHFALVDVFCDDAHPGRIASVLTADRLYPDSVGARRQGLVTLLDNHDLPRILSRCHDDEQRVRNALAFMLTARGTPSFTWGTESGLRGSTEPDNRADMRFELTATGEAMKRWLAVRRETAAITSGYDVLLSLGPRHLEYARVAGTQTVVVAINQGTSIRPLQLPDAEWRNLETGAKLRQPRAAPGVSVYIADVTIPRATGEVEVEFRVKNAPPGELRIVGSGPELGNWDPLRAPRADAVRLPIGAAFAYQPVVIAANAQVQWAGSDRFLLARATRVDIDFNAP